MLQDYNDIFNLVTVPNLFLTWYVSEYPASDDIAVAPELKSQFIARLKELGIEFQFLVGGWGEKLIVTYPFFCSYGRTTCKSTI